MYLLQVHESAVGTEEPRRGSTDNRIILSKCRNVQTDLKQIMNPHSVVQQSRHRSHAPPRFTAGVVGPREGRRSRGRGRRSSSGAGDNAQVNEIIRHGKIEVAKTDKEAVLILKAPRGESTGIVRRAEPPGVETDAHALSKVPRSPLRLRVSLAKPPLQPNKHALQLRSHQYFAGEREIDRPKDRATDSAGGTDRASPFVRSLC